MGDVIRPNFQTTVDIPPDQILECAMNAKLKQVILIGMGEDCPYYASTTADIGEMLFRMEMFKNWLINEAERRG